ncbi:MAG: 3'-5' exonuclease domain-containing protein 2 [Muribaculaceae bacterium]|nr:3'-5' exonuclease domain-containing protein 2 [Muribaculaceae bacterium]MDE5857466.1 3'-5' exonuclease domain-containing protein 2 [Muribaculaceae bacterium]MDE7155721.1 3'-5' exonuclease domain-containing protein 2 [Muribaculaceae bacterium]MDE7370017.1 3'-5' exonuclease domain-containing protein 2 [Muribaculaceae bacterium]
MLSITKDQIAQLPVRSYAGRAILINTMSDARAAMIYLNKQTIVGFDTETRPSFKKGQVHKVALLQLSTADECFLFRLNHLGLFDELKDFLSNESIIKVGLSIKDDFHALNRLGQIEPAGFIELQSHVKDFEIADNSLQKIFAIIFNERISKTQRLTNWEADVLTEAQQAYAALDAWACLKIYNYLKEGHFDPKTSQYIAPEPEISSSEN